MKHKKILFVVLLAVIALNGCITCLHPLYTLKDLVFDARLLGTWKDSAGESTWKLESVAAIMKAKGDTTTLTSFATKLVNDKSYMLTYTEGKQKAEFLFNLLKLANNYYIDIYPAGMGADSKLVEDYYMPVHTFGRIKVEANSFNLEYMNAELIYKLLSENRIRIKHENVEYGSLITASTQELQQFVIKYAGNKDFYSEPVTYRKIK
ncbi:hypothetical protein SAMN05444266_10222 [Chitinophaga jiangningensis]|uniref:Uncharacterized protein n=1 Tax=Chitinophaga jiangningensis TaxID=1419482 RepID=A0A1M6XTZ6_9BACT|nr:hypothetical protein [Chitinophaga jiangningensis]SHL09457.1 hypothetical protein SAMN05444266_10222 [Chitinophaga jiangningensis]